MKGETVASKLNPQTANLNSLGGGGFESIIGSDIGAVMMACDATPLIWSYFFAYHKIGFSYNKHIKCGDQYKRIEISYSFNDFAQNLEDWVFKNYFEWVLDDDPIKALNKATAASEEISKGLARYLSEKPKEEDRIWPFFKPVKIDTFRRK